MGIGVATQKPASFKGMVEIRIAEMVVKDGKR
jgi:hypothetical protein